MYVLRNKQTGEVIDPRTTVGLSASDFGCDTWDEVFAAALETDLIDGFEVIDLRNVWNELETPVFDVMTDGSHTASAHVRQLDADRWIYVDEVDGFSIQSNESVKHFSLATA